MRIRTVLKTLVVCLGMIACFSVAARADTYTYTGPAYVSCQGTFVCTGTAPAQTATINFKPGTQLDNLSMTDVTLDILSFSYTDGESSPLTMITTISPTFEIATDASGNITSWNLEANDVSFVGKDIVIRDISSENFPGAFGDFSEIEDVSSGTGGFGFSAGVGAWSKSPVTTPECGSGLMAAAAFVVLAGIALGRRSRDLPVA